MQFVENETVYFPREIFFHLILLLNWMALINFDFWIWVFGAAEDLFFLKTLILAHFLLSSAGI